MSNFKGPKQPFGIKVLALTLLQILPALHNFVPVGIS